MNTPGPSDDDDVALHAALQRDAQRTRQLLPFDPALHASTMRSIRALANAQNRPSASALPAFSDRPASWFNDAATWRSHRGWLATTGVAALVLVGFFFVGVCPPTAPGRTRPGARMPHSGNGDFACNNGETAARPSDGTAGNYVPSSFSEHVHGARFNPGVLSVSAADARLLVASLNGTSEAQFDLEAPDGPIRLDCGYTSSDGGSLGLLLTRPILGDRRPF